ncbi:MAG: hypothetical protein ACRCTY_10755, partial [Candidatus Adiutrix sp.]
MLFIFDYLGILLLALTLNFSQALWAEQDTFVSALNQHGEWLDKPTLLAQNRREARKAEKGQKNKNQAPVSPHFPDF